ncbi:MAG: choice-of-anchor E domain-containing protein [Limisphaerales bacterium]
MNKLIVRGLGAGTALALVLAANQSRAQDWTTPSADVTYTFNGVDNNLQNQPAAFVTLPQFNPALGTLEEVQISFQGNAVFNGATFNNSGNAGAFTSLTANVAATAPTLNTVTLNIAGPGGYFNAPTSGTSDPYGTGGTITYPTSPINITISSITPAVLSAYQGSGDVNIPLSAQLASLGGPVLSYASGTSQAGATFHIEYEYSAVPEASTIGLVAGLGCLVALFRRARN